jgi:hypothetical protein
MVERIVKLFLTTIRAVANPLGAAAAAAVKSSLKYKCLSNFSSMVEIAAAFIYQREELV